MATYQLKQTRSDGVPVNPVSFTIPDTNGTYKLTFNLSDGRSIDGGNVVVDGNAHTYRINVVKGDSEISANIDLPLLAAVAPIIMDALITSNYMDSSSNPTNTLSLKIYNNNSYQETATVTLSHRVNGSSRNFSQNYTVSANSSYQVSARLSSGVVTMPSLTVTFSNGLSTQVTPAYKTLYPDETTTTT